MRTFDELKIDDRFSFDAPVPRARKILGKLDGVWRAAGWLMPQLKDSRQQPKSLAFRLLEDRLDTKS